MKKESTAAYWWTFVLLSLGIQAGLIAFTYFLSILEGLPASEQLTVQPVFAAMVITLIQTIVAAIGLRLHGLRWLPGVLAFVGSGIFAAILAMHVHEVRHGLQPTFLYFMHMHLVKTGWIIGALIVLQMTIHMRVVENLKELLAPKKAD